MENNRNFFITIALSVLILTLWQVFYMNPRIETEREARVAAEQAAEVQPSRRAPPANAGSIPVGVPTAPGSAGGFRWRG